MKKLTSLFAALAVLGLISFSACTSTGDKAATTTDTTVQVAADTTPAAVDTTAADSTVADTTVK
jgi:hypothetical protein